jgi:NAD(P)-dependent dehydrogenase (short-subunit alcohol dehydrogenase family)
MGEITMNTFPIFSLSGKTALLTGASGYFGQNIARSLLQAGAVVWLNGRNADVITALAGKFRAEGLAAHPAAFDITSEDEIVEFFSRFGGAPLDILINNAYAGTTGAIEVARAENYRESYEVAMIAPHNLVRHGLTSLRSARRQNGDATVINIASMYGMVSPDLRVYPDKASANAPFYGAAKAALLQWTRYAACEFGSEGIRFNAVMPGAFPSPEVQGRAAELIEQLEKKIPLGRIGSTEEIGGVVVFLASPAASYINGATLTVDGGWTAW